MAIYTEILTVPLLDTRLPEGLHSVNWNGIDAAGRRVESGVYFYRLTIDSKRVAERRIIVLS